MPSINSIIFYGLSVLLVISAIGVVTFKSVFHSAMALVAALSLVAGIFLLLGADFLAASQILVYVGGIMIIMLFVIMLSQQPLDMLKRQTNDQWFPGLCFSLVLGGSLIWGFREFLTVSVANGELWPTSSAIGRLLLGDMVVPFEAVSLVLLAALVGAVLFGQDRMSPK